MHSYVSKDLAINFYSSSVQAINKAAVGQIMQPGCRINTGNPQRTELTFTLPTITVSILARFRDGLIGGFIKFATGTVVTLGFL
jgi:hypothetical protein